jgi:hypothetical protein
MMRMPDGPEDECAEVVESDSAVEGGAKVGEGETSVTIWTEGEGDELVMVQGRPLTALECSNEC